MKRTILLWVWLWPMCSHADPAPVVLTFPANTGIVISTNEFSRLNPAYKQRAGSYYEITYLPKATEELIAAANLTNEQKPSAFEALRAFIYDWLDAMVRDGGRMSEKNRRAVIALMDGRFEQLLSPDQFKQYARWREDRSHNPLAFLIHYRDEPPKDKPETQPDR